MTRLILSNEPKPRLSGGYWLPKRIKIPRRRKTFWHISGYQQRWLRRAGNQLRALQAENARVQAELEKLSFRGFLKRVIKAWNEA
tara:strand:- start:460 stop:714 length:255 start_codon:yes stop_codon:yes gene_type:complete